jgi:DNA-directed RNA polymerase specialized sigma subunit
MEKDVELYNQWKKSQNPQHLDLLIKQLDPLIQSQVNQRSGTLARPLLEAQAKVLTVRAIQSYSPDRGAKLSTHVTNQLQKLSRVNYAHQNALRIPEHSMVAYRSYNIALEDFKTDNGREPTSQELADHMKWSPKKVEQFRTQFGRAELTESKDTPMDMFVPYTHDPRIDYAYQSMSPRQQKIFEHMTGYQNAPKLSNTQLMTKLGITQGVLSYEKSKIKTLLERAQR